MLEPVAQRPGLWHDPSWNGKTPATFAVIIGCSAYDHLKGGTDAASSSKRWVMEARDLGQLYVSALTARRVFDWLRQDYRMASAPLTRCWLLLSPTADELAAAPELAEHLRAPTLDACDEAINDWASMAEDLPKPAQSGARSIFFFSGHGLQSTVENPLLLPCDYLSGNRPDWDDAISIQNLRNGFNSVPVTYRYYFVDSCRNDFPEIRQMRPEGKRILPVYPTSDSYHGIEIDAVLYATIPAKRAWQPKSAADGPTIFAQALLEGLQGLPDIEIDAKDGVPTVNFTKLEEFVRKRVPEIIKSKGSRAEQQVTPAGTVRDRPVTELDPASDTIARVADNLRVMKGQPPGETALLERLSEMIERLTPRGPLTVHVPSLGLGGPRAPGTPGVIRHPATGEILRRPSPARPARTIRRLKDPDLQAAGWSRDFNAGHRLFGRESVTDLFSSSMRVSSLGMGEWLPPDAMRLLQVTRDRSGDADEADTKRYTLRIVIENDEEKGHWLQIRSGERSAAGIFLPMDHSRASVFDLDVVLSSDWPLRVHTLDALPYESDSKTRTARAAKLWRFYQDENVDRAARYFEGSELRNILYDKVQAPLAATIAALVLLRADRLDLMSDWAQNLANWFDYLSDGSVIWAEQVWRQRGEGESALLDIAQPLATLEENGLPMTGEALGYAVGLVDRIAPDVPDLPEELRASIQTVQDRLHGALRFFRPGGLFASFSGFDENTIPYSGKPPENVDGVALNGIFLPIRP